jgi:hypothetical protein
MRQVHETEDYRFESTEELKHFLKEDWSYGDKNIDLLLKEQFEVEGYSDAHEKTETTVKLTPDNSGGFTKWHLTLERSGVEYDNY